MVLPPKIIWKIGTEVFILQENDNEVEASIQVEGHAKPTKPAKAHFDHLEEQARLIEGPCFRFPSFFSF